MTLRFIPFVLPAACLWLVGCTYPAPDADEPLVLRIATFNVEDIRTPDLEDPNHPRLKQVARILQELRPDIVLINELAYDQQGAPGYVEGEAPGQNGQRLVDRFLSVSQGPGLEPLQYHTFMAPSNTGLASGFDLDNDGQVAAPPADLPGTQADGAPGQQTAEGRAYGNDAWGFGLFPGQYAMALLVNERFTILDHQARTFQTFRWSRLPDALRPTSPDTGEPWHTDEEWTQLRLSSKSHWDVPVQLPNGAILHVLCSHPTPPAFDGPEGRNKTRNHDEIRFWAEYLNGADFITDDTGRTQPFPADEPFVLLGDQNADPDEGAAIDDPMGQFLLNHPRVNATVTPTADRPLADLDDDDTARWGLRVDYVLPSRELEVIDSGIYRYEDEEGPSDHFPVWIDVAVDGR